MYRDEEDLPELLFKSLETINFYKNIIGDPTGNVQKVLDVPKYMWQGFKEAWDRDFVNGDAESRTAFITYGLTSLGIGAIGDKGLGKIGTTAKTIDDVADAAKSVKVDGKGAQPALAGAGAGGASVSKSGAPYNVWNDPVSRIKTEIDRVYGGKGTAKTGPRSEIDEVIKNDYDKDGNIINRSIVPKGFNSVEDFLTKVDDTTIKEFGYDSVEEFKAVVGNVDDYLNSSPKNNIINKGLAGGKHVKGVEYDVLGFPIFKGDDVKFSLKLKESLFKGPDDTQFKECTGLLKEAIEQGKIPKDIFTPKQLRDIENGEARIKGLTWHHHQVPGKIQLVVSKTHKVNHLGGNKLWGDGIR